MRKPLLQHPSWRIICKRLSMLRGQRRHSVPTVPDRVVGGIILLLLVRLATGLFANTLYEHRFTAWRGNQSLPHGAPAGRLLVTAALITAIYGITLYVLVAAAPPGWLTTFPADKALFSTVEGWLAYGATPDDQAPE
jgi:hypothetical protein